MPKAPGKEKAKPKAATATSPFKTRRTREPDAQASDTIEPPAEIAQAIDQFREFQEQAKHFEGEATVQKDIVMQFGQEMFTKRVLNGKTKSFKVLGEQSMVTFVVMDASAGLTEEEVEAFRERWGDDAADTLITNDLASIRFDAKVLEANFEAVVEALQVLPKSVFESLFKPMLMKATPGAVEAAKKYAKSAEELKEIVQQLKIKNYIR